MVAQKQTYFSVDNLATVSARMAR